MFSQPPPDTRKWMASPSEYALQSPPSLTLTSICWVSQLSCGFSSVSEKLFMRLAWMKPVSWASTSSLLGALQVPVPPSAIDSGEVAPVAPSLVTRTRGPVTVALTVTVPAAPAL